jgi:hypothetical protein
MLQGLDKDHNTEKGQKGSTPQQDSPSCTTLPCLFPLGMSSFSFDQDRSRFQNSVKKQYHFLRRAINSSIMKIHKEKKRRF